MRPSTPRIRSNDLETSAPKFSTPNTRRPFKMFSSSKSKVLSTSPDLKHLKSAPKIELESLLHKNKSFYINEPIGRNFDQILGNIYETVFSKKSEKDDVQIKQDIFIQEINCLEKDILKLVFKKKAFIQDLEHVKLLLKQCESSLRCLQEKAFKRKYEMQEKQAKIIDILAILSTNAKDLTQENAKFGNEIILQRTHQKTKITYLRQELETCKEELKKAEMFEDKIKKNYNEMRQHHYQKIEKLRNKERAFFGIIKH